MHRLDLCSRIFHRRPFYSRILRSPDLSSVLRAHLCPRIAGGQDTSVLLHEPMRDPGILRYLFRTLFHSLCRGVLNGLCGLDLRVRIFLCRPSLELPEQRVRCWITLFRLICRGGFSGGYFIAGRRILCGRRQRLSIGGRLNQGRCLGGSLNRWRRPIGARLQLRITNQRSLDLRNDSHGISHG